MDFIKNLKETQNQHFNSSVTENGAVGFRTTETRLIDLNFAVTSLRDQSEQEIIHQFAEAFYENKLLAVKWFFLHLI